MDPPAADYREGRRRRWPRSRTQCQHALIALYEREANALHPTVYSGMKVGEPALTESARERLTVHDEASRWKHQE